MILAVVALAQVSAEVVLPPRPDSPTAAEKAILVSVAAKCGMHDGTVYFIQEDVPREPLIYITKELGDTDAQVWCVLQALPKDFFTKFGSLTEAPRKR